MSHRQLPSLSLFLSPLLIHQLSRAGRPGADWRKNTSLNPIPNPQQALKHMHIGGPKAARWRSCSEGYYSLSSQQRRAGAQQKQKKAPATSALLRALCALESRVTWPMLPCFLQRTYGGEVFLISVSTYQMLLCGGECLSCGSVSLLVKKKEEKKSREVMEVGEAATAAWFGCSH